MTILYDNDDNEHEIREELVKELLQLDVFTLKPKNVKKEKSKKPIKE